MLIPAHDTRQSGGVAAPQPGYLVGFRHGHVLEVGSLVNHNRTQVYVSGGEKDAGEQMLQ